MERVYPNRKRLRLKHYDYSTPGYYFLTLCTLDRAPLLGQVVSGVVILSTIGQVVERHIQAIPGHYDAISLDKYIIMPNHVHLILRITAWGQPDIPNVIGKWKAGITRELGRPLFQDSYYDHVIRCEADYLHIWNYIDTNPAKWREDCYFEEVLP